MDEDQFTRMEQKLEEISQRLKKLETAHDEHRSLFGPNVWVLVPVVAIIMWGLQGIF
jgi:hypothetical protein